MKNFPSSLIKQKTTRQGLADTASGTLKNIGSKILKNILSKGNTGADLSVNDLNQHFNSGYEILDLEHEIDNININKHHLPLSKLNGGEDIDKLLYDQNSTLLMNPNLKNGSNYNDIYFEDPFLFSASIFSVINNYKYILKSTIPSVLEHPMPVEKTKDGKPYTGDYHMSVLHTAAAPSLFNPFNGVDVIGITEYVPLIAGNNKDINKGDSLDNGFGKDGDPDNKEATLQLSSFLPPGYDQTEDISDCTIKKLVELSKDPKKGLGLATYRYADFMFCKDLGKVSNNHLITLRKFPGPIGDNIFGEAYPENEDNPYAAYPDIGRLITWFGTDDNKLEDICRFNYNATWKEFHAEIQQKASEQKDEGILDKIANSFSPQNNSLVGKGFSSNTGLLGWGASKINIPIIGNDRMSSASYGWELLSNYDQNKIYTPENTIWDTHKYEGKLTFNQEITLTFRYVLRSYSNINPKSAFLDLLGNIMVVTYRSGSFWGGETKVYGPQGNNSVYKTANAWIDKGFEKLGGVWNLFASGQFSMADLQGWLGNVMDAAKDALGGAMEGANTIVKAATGDATSQEQVKSKAQDTAKTLINMNKQYGWTNALKGMLKNQLGRPAIYAFNSLLTGEAVGPWHLTIGNPRNPIMSMGNMIITGSEIQQLGPLGIDDFPSEIKLVVQLKHGRPRDAVEIEKMYTKGRSSIYKPMNMMQLTNYVNNPIAFGDVIEFDSYAGNNANEEQMKNDEQVMNSNNYDSKQKQAAKQDYELLKKSIHNDNVLQKILRNI